MSSEIAVIIQVLTTILAVAGFGLSIFNYRNTSRNAERQHAIAYAGDITSWAADVLRIYRRIGSSRYSSNSKKATADLMQDIINDLSLLYDIGGLYIAKNDGEAIEEVRKLLKILADEYQAVLEGSEFCSLSYFEASRFRFTNAVRNDIGIQKRHAEAQRYLA